MRWNLVAAEGEIPWKGLKHEEQELPDAPGDCRRRRDSLEGIETQSAYWVQYNSGKPQKARFPGRD